MFTVRSDYLKYSIVLSESGATVRKRVCKRVTVVPECWKRKKKKPRLPADVEYPIFRLLATRVGILGVSEL